MSRLISLVDVTVVVFRELINPPFPVQYNPINDPTLHTAGNTVTNAGTLALVTLTPATNLLNHVQLVTLTPATNLLNHVQLQN